MSVARPFAFAWPIACACLIAFALPANAQTAEAAPIAPQAPAAGSAAVSPSSSPSSSASAPASTPAPTPASAASPSAPAPASPAASPLASPDAVPISVSGVGGVGKRYTTWDLNIDGAYGRLFTDPSRAAGFGRVRAGVLLVRDPTFLSLGATYELSNFSSATLGVQGEWLNLEVGVWAQAGVLLDVDGPARFGVMGAVGWSVVGVEVQGRDVAGSGFVPAFFAKLRIPISIIAFGIRGR